MAVSHLFPYPDCTVCNFKKSFKTLCFHRENTDDDTKPYVFIRKIATGARSLFFHMKTNEKLPYVCVFATIVSYDAGAISSKRVEKTSPEYEGTVDGNLASYVAVPKKGNRLFT